MYEEENKNIENQDEAVENTANSNENFEEVNETVIEQEIPVINVEEEPKKEKKDNKRFKKIVCYAAIFGIVAGVVGSVTNTAVTKLVGSKLNLSTTGVVTKTTDESSVDSLIADVAENCMPSIVSITNKGQTEVMTFFGNYLQETTSSGSGIIIGKNSTELLIVTNYHVVADSKELTVFFTDPDDDSENMGIDVDDAKNSSKSFSAQVKGYDSDKDLAVISIKLSDIKADTLAKIKIATIGNSSKVRAGERVIAIGNALGYGQSVTTGIISATKRSVTMQDQQTGAKTTTNKFIQTDAAINPGNSGGALLNVKGELIGINSAKISASGVEGMCYAIPISDVESIIGDLMNIETREEVPEEQQGFLGITGQDISDEVADAYGMPAGVFVKSVAKDMAADKAGIKKGNIITKFDGREVKTIAQLQDILTHYKKGETKKITVMINDGTEYKAKELNIKLGSKKEDSKKMLQDDEDDD